MSPSRYAPRPVFKASVRISVTVFPCDIGLKTLSTFSIHQARSSFALGDGDIRASYIVSLIFSKSYVPFYL